LTHYNTARAINTAAGRVEWLILGLTSDSDPESQKFLP
jgi:hypothetical protein